MNQIKEEVEKRHQRENILKAVRDRKELLSFEDGNREFIYPNQIEAANLCVQAYKNGATAVCLIAQPGTGKTGTAHQVMIQMTTDPCDDDIIYSDDCITCTGMADNDWTKQYQKNVFPCFQSNTFHRQHLIKKENKQKLNSLRNGLIVMDECHVASGAQMTIAKTLKDVGILDVNVLKLRNIFLLEISATPGAVLHDLKSWGEKACIIKLHPGKSYKGFEVMLSENRIIDSPNLENLTDYYKFLEFWDERYKNTTKKYFPCRLLDQNKINILETVADNLGWKCKNHNSGERIDDVDEMMRTAPQHHTIIFIKGFWRASKRILIQHVGGTYEQIPKKRDVSVTAQALTARFCDNYEYSGDHLDINLRPIHYCDKGAIEQYVRWFNNNCDFNISTYTSHGIRSNGRGNVTSKKTKLTPSVISGLDNVVELEQRNKEPIIKKFSTQEDAKKYYKDELKIRFSGRGPNKIIPNEDGYFYATIRSKKRVYSCEEILSEKKHGLTFNNYRFYPCYQDVKNKSTLEFWFIHY